MADSHETEPRFVVPLPGGRIARVPFSVLEQYADSNARSVHVQQKRALGLAPGGSKPINTTQITAGESMITINIYAASGEVAIDREETTTQQVVINHSADAADDDDVVAHSLAVDAATVSAAQGKLLLQYNRWLNSDYTPYMQNAVEVWDGSSWQQLWVTGGSPGVTDAAWTPVEFDISQYKNAALRVRFGFQIGSSGVFTVSQWNLDDVAILTSGCP